MVEAILVKNFNDFLYFFWSGEEDIKVVDNDRIDCFSVQPKPIIENLVIALNSVLRITKD
jgi:hypothetical protein